MREINYDFMEEIIEFIDYNVFGFFTDNLEQRVMEVLDNYYEHEGLNDFEYDYLEQYYLGYVLNEEDDEDV